MNRIIIFVLICLISTNIFAAGETGLSFLKIGVGARATAMGEAFTAVSDDATGMFWNPAGTAWYLDRFVHFTHNSWIQGINHEVANVCFPAFSGTLGFGLVLNNVDDLERRTIASEEPVGTFSAHDFSFSANYARMFGERLSVGANVKYINEKIYFETASGYAADIGVKYKVFDSGLSVGAVVQNLGTLNELAQESIKLPQTIRLGTAFLCPLRIVQSTWLLTADYVKIVDDDAHLYFGTEVRPISVFSLRAGYQTGHEDKDFAAGMGLLINRFQFDYAYIPFSSNLGASQRISLIASF